MEQCPFHQESVSEWRKDESSPLCSFYFLHSLTLLIGWWEGHLACEWTCATYLERFVQNRWKNSEGELANPSLTVQVVHYIKVKVVCTVCCLCIRVHGAPQPCHLAPRLRHLCNTVGTAPPALCAPMSSFYGSLCSASNVNWQRGATRICCCVPCCLAPAMQHSISPANWAHSSKPATAVCSGWMTGWTDKRTDGRTPGLYIDPALHTMWAVPTRMLASKLLLFSFCENITGIVFRVTAC